jgi:hypothetical protein
VSGGLVEAAVLHDPVLAEIIRGRLEAEGVRALLFDSGLAGLLGGGGPGIRLMVPSADLAHARALIALPIE